MHSRLLSLRSAAALLISLLLVLVAFEPAAAEPTPAGTPAATVGTEPAEAEESPEPVEEQPPAESPEPPAEEAPSAPVEDAPPAEAPILGALKAERVDDGALSDLVTVENVEVPEDTLRALSATDDSILEKVDLSPFHMAAVSWDQDVEATGVSIVMSVRVAGEWTEWEDLPLADGEGSPSASDPLWTSEPADGVRARVTSDQGALPDLKITTVDPGPEDVATPEGGEAGELTGFASVAQPAIISRSGWGAGPGQSCDATRGSMRSVVIHHTAGANSYSKAQSAGIVRSYQTMHIVTNGWCDIGYNFLVDKYGQIFEGRAGSIAGHRRGAHAGVGAVNDNSTGIAMMGNFETANIWNGEWNTLRSTVSRLTAWRLQRFGLKPLTQVTLAGRTNFTVNGHRNWMATACPGRYGLDWLNAGNGLRADVDKLMHSGGGGTPALAAPGGFQVSSASSSALNLRWNAVSGAQRYRIWYREGTNGTPKQWTAQPTGTSASITGLRANTTYSVAVAGVRSSGAAGTYTAYTAFRTGPTTPQGITATAEGPSLRVSWKATAGAQRYRVWYREGANGTPKQWTTQPSGTSTTITGLKRGTEYRVAVAALGANNGQSAYTAYTPFRTGPAAPGGLAVKPSNTSVDVSWRAVSGAQRYRVWYREGANGTPKQWTTEPTSTSVKITGLKAASPYSVAVTAVTAAGRGDYTDYTPFATLTVSGKPAPETPINLRATKREATALTVTWDAARGAQRYRVWYREGANGTPKQWTTQPTKPGVTLTKLKPGTEYRVAVSTLGADGTQSDYTEYKPYGTLPGMPAQLKASSASDALTVSWAATPGAQRYRVWYREGANGTPKQLPTEPTGTSATLTGLASDTEYRVAVSAISGGGQQSAYTAYTPFRTAPGVPQNLTASATPTSLKVSWKAVKGAARYRVWYREGANGTPRQAPQEPPGTSITLSGLKPGVDYQVAVSSLSSANRQSAYTAYTSFYTGVATPTKLSATPGGDRLQLSWSDVPGAQRYRIWYREGANGSPKQWPTEPTAANAAVDGLKPEATYYVAVAALGAGGRQSAYTAYTPFRTTSLSRLSTPQSLRLGARSASSIRVDWNAVAGAQRYRIWYREGANGTPRQLPTEPTVANATVTGLKAGSEYRFAVAALAPGVDQSDYTVYTPFRTIPAVPSGLTGSASSSSLNVNWSAVAGAQRYRIWYREGANGSPKQWPSEPTGTSVSITGLKAGVEYRVAVSALGPDGGQGAYTAYTAFRTAAAGSSNSATFSNGSVTMKGHGYGHGVGMSQYGAQGGALQGNSYQQILSHYYPGTKLATRSARVRVQISGAPTDALTVRPKSGLMVQSAGGGPNKVLPARPDGRHVDLWQVVRAGDSSRNQLRYNTGGTWHNHGGTWRGDVQFGVDGGTVTALFGSQDRTFRGVIRWWTGSGSARTTVNELFSLDDYIRGVVPREMPSGWHQQALRSQAVAARTYTVRTMNPSSPAYDICDTTACQVYGGYNAEAAATNTAIDATRGQVLMYGNTPAFTQYSSSSGGYTNWPSYPKEHPYLKPVKDDWDAVSSNPNHSWTTTISADAVKRAYPQIGTARSIQVTARNGYGSMGGRVDKVRITGSSGSVEITGNGARTAFGLKSNWFGF
ncbi:fibronectin type III domain-containing protein [Aeromicrobium piscarium]|nr:fibronectin type III domain-containing protein [Aeromicrobium piscarium]